jgi:hypothetical protein
MVRISIKGEREEEGAIAVSYQPPPPLPPTDLARGRILGRNLGKKC